jgi:hypothetical protein
MGNDPASVSRHAKVKFMGTTDELVGTIIFSGTETEIGATGLCTSNFKFKPDDAAKPERLFDFWRVDMITFLD